MATRINPAEASAEDIQLFREENIALEADEDGASTRVEHSSSGQAFKKVGPPKRLPLKGTDD